MVKEGEERLDSNQDFNSIINGAISHSINEIRSSYGIHMSPQQLSEYLDPTSVYSEAEKIIKSPKFEKLEEQDRAKFLYDKLIQHIVKDKPFNKSGRELLEGSLEGIVGKTPKTFWSKLFSKNDENNSQEEYVRDQQTLKGILKNIEENKEHYSEINPNLIEDYKKLKEGYSLTSTAETLYAGGRLTKDLYHGIKKKTAHYADKIFGRFQNQIEKYVNGATAAFFGVGGMITLFSSKMTGNVIGNGNFTGDLFFGGALLAIAILLTYLDRK